MPGTIALRITANELRNFTNARSGNILAKTNTFCPAAFLHDQGGAKDWMKNCGAYGNHKLKNISSLKITGAELCLTINSMNPPRPW
jgi:hypothetical protein